ncbi:peptidoglycan DD-metalloendopeptidase family protein [Proteiniborus sp. MB09-C3]
MKQLRYNHLQCHSANLKVGERVKQGQVIGLVGNTGMGQYAPSL